MTDNGAAGFVEHIVAWALITAEIIALALTVTVLVAVTVVPWQPYAANVIVALPIIPFQLTNPLVLLMVALAAASVSVIDHTYESTLEPLAVY